MPKHKHNEAKTKNSVEVSSEKERITLRGDLGDSLRLVADMNERNASVLSLFLGEAEERLITYSRTKSPEERADLSILMNYFFTQWFNILDMLCCFMRENVQNTQKAIELYKALFPSDDSGDEAGVI
jgi:hypothetical protein